jgi:hypothetical protein
MFYTLPRADSGSLCAIPNRVVCYIAMFSSSVADMDFD